MAYTIDAAVLAAQAEVGYRESGTNQTKFNRWLGPIGGTTAYAWCVSFECWVADRAGGRANVDYPRTASCLVAVAWFKSHDRWSSKPHVGDWVFYGPGGGTHVELVIGVNSRAITTIGGNTSGSLNGAYYNGDGVYKKTVTRASSRIYGYGRPAYNSKEDDDMPTPKDLWQWDGIEAPTDDATGKYLNPKNEDWRPDSYLRESYLFIRRIHKLVGQLVARDGADVDEDAIAAAVLAGLTPEKIAAAIPQDIGEQVAEALAARLAAGKE